MSDDLLHVGIARADITPPVGIKSAGYASRGPLVAHHDPLYADALFFRYGVNRVVLISCDLIGLGEDVVSTIRARIASRINVLPDHITVSCTHTHYGPDPYRDSSDPLVSAYRENLCNIIAGIAQEAASKAEPAVIGVGWSESDIGVNRRQKLPDGRIILGNNPEGPIDRSLGVMRIDSIERGPIACLVNFQCHPVSQTSRVDHISADYPGKAKEVFEKITGCPCVFLQGACGNINTKIKEACYEPARKLGTQLGCDVARTWESISPCAVHGVAITARVAELPAFRYLSPERAAALEESLARNVEQLRAQGAFGGMIGWTEARLNRVRAARRSWETGELPPPILAEVQACRIGDFAYATAPGEIFNQIGVQVKSQSPYRDTFFIGYANGSIGYVPVSEAYEEGGYEVMDACRVDPGADKILAEECLKALNSLA